MSEAGVQAQTASGDDDLRVSLAALPQLASGQMQLGEVLTRVAEVGSRPFPVPTGSG